MGEKEMRSEWEAPPFLRERLLEEYGGEAERVLAGYGMRRSVTLRVNPLRGEREETVSRLRELGFCLREVGWYRDAFVLPDATEQDLFATSLFGEGKIYLQSLSSMLPPLALLPAAGETVLDMTAAPGGKTCEMAALSGGGALITACERDKIRFGRLKFNVERQGAPRVTLLNEDALRLNEFFRFDKVLLDAPCSGSGTLSAEKHGAFSEKLLAACVSAQGKLLKKGYSLLKRGGRLLYSTCSVLKEENERQLEPLLAAGARLLPLSLSLDGATLLSGREGTITICPDEMFEGFFLALLEKP